MAVTITQNCVSDYILQLTHEQQDIYEKSLAYGQNPYKKWPKRLFF